MNYLRSMFRSITAPFRWLFGWPLRLIAAPRRLLGLSFPARISVLLAIFLVICTVTAYLIFFFGDRSEWDVWVAPTRLLAIVALLVIIPLLVYQTLRLWLQGTVSRYPDIDQAWKQGVTALEKNNLDLASLPIFLVVGAGDERSARSLFQASALTFQVSGAPAGAAPLHWYADQRAIFLVVVGTGCLGQLNQMAEQGSTHASGTTPTAGAPSLTGTLVADGSAALPSDGALEPVAQTPSPAASLYETLVPDAGTMPGAPASEGPSAGAPAGGSGSRILSRAAIDQQAQRLDYVCQLLRKERQPLCPLNGVLTLLPFDVVQNVIAARELPAAVKTDVSTIRDSTRLHCPVTAVITGMESERGFCELLRRVGFARAKAHRFGKGFDVWVEPTPENVDALSSHACGAFEDWVYSLFREENGLSKPGNSKLYSMLCKIRSHVHTRLRNILVHAYSHDAGGRESGQQPMLFSGCYFAATGDTEDRQAFVKNILEKVISLEEDLEWTDQALAEDRRFQRLAQAFVVANGLLLLSLIGMLIVSRMR